MKAVQIGNHRIGPGYPVFIIAEAGVNHNGKLALAKKLVYAAKKAGADCVKFQTFKAENLVTEDAPKAAYQLKVTDPRESQRQMLENLELRPADYKVLKKLCKQLNIVFMSTPYNFEDVDFLENLGVPAYKLASIHLTEIPMIQYVAKKRKPLILSTGMSRLSDVLQAAKAFTSTGNKNLILLQCTTNYPTDHEHVHLRAIATIAKETRIVTGYSDHTRGIEAAVLSVAAGAHVIEKHFTLDKKMPGPDHSSSADPKEFADLVRRVREAEKMLGLKEKKISSHEERNIRGMKRSLVATQAIPAGTVIQTHMLGFKRPATGLLPNMLFKVVGRTAKRDILENAVLVKADIL